MIEIVEVPAGQIHPYPQNNRLNENTVEVLVKLIERVGFNVPLVIDRAGVIVKGHARFKAGKRLGMTEFPCIVSENTDEVNNQDRILDNKISELSKWDNEKLMYEIEGVEVDLRDIGLNFHHLRAEIREVEQRDIDAAVERLQVQDDEMDTSAFLSVNCPKCGGYFEYKAKAY